MKSSLKNFTDFFDHPEDHESALSQTQMVVTTQIVGLGLIAVALFSLKTPDWQWKLEVGLPALGVGAIFLILWTAYCWGDLFFPRLRQLRNGGYRIATRPYSTRNSKLLRATFLLVLADTALVTVLIVITGGVGSPLDPLLGAISIIAITTKQPFRTISSALALFLLIVSALTVLHALHPQVATSTLIYDAHTDPRFHGIFGTMVVSVTILSVIEYWLSYETPALLASIPDTVEMVLRNTPLELDVDDLTKQITKGARRWVRWLSDRRMPLKDLSLVHDESDVIEQAVVLCVPYWLDDIVPGPSPLAFLEWAASASMFLAVRLFGLHKYMRPCSEIVQGWSQKLSRRLSSFRRWQDRQRKRKIAQHVTFLTLAAHWIDDHFDALQEHCPDDITRQKILRESPEQLMNPVILRRLFPRLNEVICGMQKRAHKQNRHQIRHAVTRIIYGGLVQHASSRKRFEELRDGYIRFIDDNLFGEQRALYHTLAQSRRPLTIFLTAKVVMELLDSCRQISDPASLIKQAEFFNLLYCPILYYHDRDQELEFEQYGKAFGDRDEIKKSLPTVPELVAVVKSCEGLVEKIFGPGGISIGRQAQLRLLLQLYSKQLPNPLINAYKPFLPTDPARLSSTPPQVSQGDQASPSATHAA